MTTFLDTNILVYLLDEASPRHQWAKTVTAERRQEGPLIISDIVYSEFSVALESQSNTDDAIRSLALERIAFSDESLFLAGKAYRRYKEENGGPKNNVLSDFLIGAQASAAGVPLVTANPDDFKSYFPAIKLITAEPN